MKIGLKLKSSIFLTLLLLSAVGILSILVLRGIQSNQRQQNEDYLIQQGEIASNYIKQIYLMESIKDPEAFINDRGRELVTRFEMITGMQVILYNLAGKEVANSRPLAGKTDVSLMLEYALQNTNTYIEDGDNIIFLSPLHNSSMQIGVLQFNYSTTSDRMFYTKIKHLFFYSGVFIFAICFISGYLYVRPLTLGILRLKNATQRIEKGDFSDLICLKRSDELGELSQNISNMGKKIKSQIETMKEEQHHLQQAVEKLEILGKQQKQFIGNVTHEFKTPLTIIKAYADLMQMYSDDPTLMNDAKVNIDKESQRLTDMLENVLSLSELENYSFEFQKEEVDIHELLTDICERMNGKIQKYGLQLHTDLEKNILLADKERLNQVFINLIDNAIKYNRPDGHIWISCCKENNFICIRVKDTGIGIPPAERDKIFQPFYTVNKSLNGGTGLGLSLVRELVEKQGGSITLLDQQAEGSTFEIRFII
jgi:signal transduction histidine kinase